MVGLQVVLGEHERLDVRRVERAQIGELEVVRREEREGDGVSLVSFGYGVGISLEAAEILQSQHGISCEVINLRTLRPLDTDSIVSSVKKTNHLVTIETGWPQCGIGSEIIAQV